LINYKVVTDIAPAIGSTFTSILTYPTPITQVSPSVACSNLQNYAGVTCTLNSVAQTLTALKASSKTLSLNTGYNF